MSAIMPAHSEQIERYTPRFIFEGLKTRFGLDPCAPLEHTPSKDYCTTWYIGESGQDGLALDWGNAFVWLNPPWQRGEKRKWIAKLHAHGNGIALVRSGTDAAFLHDYPPDAFFFLRGRLKYLLPEGQSERPRKGGAVGGFEPSQLLAFGPNAKDVLRHCTLEGMYLEAVKTTLTTIKGDT